MAALPCMRRFGRMVLATVLAAAAIAPATRAGQVRDLPELQGFAGPAVAIGGVIDSDVLRAFREALAHLRAGSAVVLSGPGGQVLPAEAIGRELRARGLATVILPGESCASACAIIWLAGERRFMGEGARLGLHAMSLRTPQGVAEWHDGDPMLRQYLMSLDYPFDTTAMIVNTPAALVRWLDRTELRNNGIDNSLYP